MVSSSTPKTARADRSKSAKAVVQVESLAFSIDSFCRSYGISRPTLYKLWSEGAGPEFMQIGRRILIPIESSNTWRARMTKSAAVVGVAK